MEAKKGNIIFLLIASLLLQYRYCSSCPQISTQHQPKFWHGYTIFSYLKIPKTNILLVNTARMNYDYISSNIVYHIDISNKLDNFLTSIQTAYTIIQMEYIQQTNQILVLNSQSLVFADPYTLNLLFSIEFNNLMGMTYIRGSNYAIVFRNNAQVFVIDVIKRRQILYLDILQYSSSYNITQPFGQLYSLQNSQNFIFVVYGNVPCTWSIDFETMKVSFNGNFSQDPWRKQIFLRSNNSQKLHPNQVQQSQSISSSQGEEKGSFYIKVFTNYLQIMGSIVSLDPSLNTSNIFLNNLDLAFEANFNSYLQQK
ncbi:hypothetical protein ABPG72_016224 [Tetrahymena utriculariae]